MEHQSIYHLLRIIPEDEENANGVMALLAGEGRNEGESGPGQPGSGVAAAASAFSRQDGPAAGAAGFMVPCTREGHDWENAQQLQQPVFWSMRDARVAQPGPPPKGKCGLSNRFSRWQLQQLELLFQRTQYISAQDRIGFKGEEQNIGNIIIHKQRLRGVPPPDKHITFP
ncbi:reproductive homeobox 1 isoform X1 [Mus musculus]|uniref:reproductive homeobox 1 isoform X1 n=1 Tax=Mus musculus TaxID=10090 RepID=UPI00001E4020|nr:reproductive homeobox 1 isoform X1 [Mus musculus]|eukprot:XP_011249273.1 PREDICTED: reproductive homeobox 1 isoform X1 [Mus musculus]